MGCGVGRRRGSDPTLLWLWGRPAATAPIGPLAWGPPCATGMALKRKKKKKRSTATDIFSKQIHYIIICVSVLTHHVIQSRGRSDNCCNVEVVVGVTATTVR